LSECSKHPHWQPVGFEWRCPHCSSSTTRTKPLTAKQKARVADAGNAVRIDDLSGGKWDTIRKRIRARDGYTCQHCRRAVRTGVVDHIKPLVDGGSNDDDNLQLLCHDCHVDKTNRDNGHKVKTAFGPDGFPIGPDHHWNR
jgi:5-methylcytosine-specific restriction enzyme A